MTVRYGWTLGYIRGDGYPTDYLTFPQMKELLKLAGRFPNLEYLVTGILDGVDKRKENIIEAGWSMLKGLGGK